MPDAPLVLTLEMDPESFDFFDHLRQQHFPNALNLVPAHISLFHHLPGEQLSAVTASVQHACQGRNSIPVRISGVRNLGRGVAFNAESPALAALHGHLSAEFSRWLTPQDRQRFKPHITIQNKAATEDATRLFRVMQAQFTSREIEGIGICIWRYLNGPWRLEQKLLFTP